MNINQIASNQMQNAMLKVSTGQKINCACDDPSGLAISNSIIAQVNGLNQATENTGAMSDLVKTADSGLANIGDGLQDIRQLSVQASNGTLSDDDRAIIQEQISQIMQGIGDTAKSTQYNNKNLLDGSFTNQNTASGADGNGKSVTISGFSASDLGIDNFNVTGDFDINDIDKAISKVSKQRSELGATGNSFSYTMDANSINSLNLAAANSRIADTNIPKAATDMNKANLMQDYQIYMQKQDQENLSKKISGMMF